MLNHLCVIDDARLVRILRAHWTQLRQWPPPAARKVNKRQRQLYQDMTQNNKLAIQMWFDQCEARLLNTPYGDAADTFVGTRRFR